MAALPRPLAVACLVGLLAALAATPARALDDERYHAASAAIDRAVAYLRDAQNDDGSWSPEPAGPAITAMIVLAMIEQPGISDSDPAVDAGVEFLLDHVQDDGGIYDRILANYNTAISLSTLAELTHRPGVSEAVAGAQAFLRELQWSVGDVDPQGNPIDESHPFYGGVGYGNHGRPDLSNVQTMVQALYDSGVACDDPAYQQAVAFISRLQGHDANDMFDADTVERDGGFIYATSIDSDHIGTPQSMANPDQVERGREGQPVSGLRSYGSMTYAGFKSYLYADLDRDDPRVLAALDWIRDNYTLERNPGMPADVQHQGLYYYYHTFARALHAWGEPTIATAAGEQRRWRADLVDQLLELQNDDGSWTNPADRWMEGDPNLTTAYALLALTYALR
ncbi:MAG: prenyltransferase/squalene oxidase repeat-containing protein [Phycisphaeraceae bacterium]